MITSYKRISEFKYTINGTEFEISALMEHLQNLLIETDEEQINNGQNFYRFTIYLEKVQE